MRPDFSTIICTRNRCNFLSKSIQSLFHQEILKEKYEIIVVDNGSTDSTKEVVKTLSSDFNIKYIYESKIGLSYARNTGWLNANGKYIGYLDDDAIASPGWIANILQAFETVSPKPGCVGGPVEPIWESSRPEWLSDDLLHGLSIIDWSDTPHFLINLKQEWLVGTNMAIDSEVLKKIGGFTSKLDRAGNILLSNGDIYIQRQIIDAGYPCFYHPEILASHHIFKSRLKKEWFIRRYFWQGVSDATMEMMENSQAKYKRMLSALSKARDLPLTPKKLINLAYPKNDPIHFTEKCFLLITIGHIAGLLGLVKR